MQGQARQPWSSEMRSCRFRNRVVGSRWDIPRQAAGITSTVVSSTPRYGLRTAVVLLGVLIVVTAVVLIGGNWARHAQDSQDAQVDRTTMQSMCSSVIDNIEGLPGGIAPSARAGMAASIAKLRDIASQISARRPEYETLTNALAGVHDRFAAGQPSGLDALIHECALIGVPPR